MQSKGVAENDIGLIQEAVMALGEFRGKPDQSKLYEDINNLMAKYGTIDMGDIDIAEVMQDLMEVMKENKNFHASWTYYACKRTRQYGRCAC